MALRSPFNRRRTDGPGLPTEPDRIPFGTVPPAEPDDGKVDVTPRLPDENLTLPGELNRRGPAPPPENVMEISTQLPGDLNAPELGPVASLLRHIPSETLTRISRWSAAADDMPDNDTTEDFKKEFGNNKKISAEEAADIVYDWMGFRNGFLDDQIKGVLEQGFAGMTDNARTEQLAKQLDIRPLLQALKTDPAMAPFMDVAEGEIDRAIERENEWIAKTVDEKDWFAVAKGMFPNFDSAKAGDKLGQTPSELGINPGRMAEFDSAYVGFLPQTPVINPDGSQQLDDEGNPVYEPGSADIGTMGIPEFIGYKEAPGKAWDDLTQAEKDERTASMSTWLQTPKAGAALTGTTPNTSSSSSNAPIDYDALSGGGGTATMEAGMDTLAEVMDLVGTGKMGFDELVNMQGSGAGVAPTLQMQDTPLGPTNFDDQFQYARITPQDAWGYLKGLGPDAVVGLEEMLDKGGFYDAVGMKRPAIGGDQYNEATRKAYGAAVTESILRDQSFFGTVTGSANEITARNQAQTTEGMFGKFPATETRKQANTFAKSIIGRELSPTEFATVAEQIRKLKDTRAADIRDQGVLSELLAGPNDEVLQLERDNPWLNETSRSTGFSNNDLEELVTEAVRAEMAREQGRGVMAQINNSFGADAYDETKSTEDDFVRQPLPDAWRNSNYVRGSDG